MDTHSAFEDTILSLSLGAQVGHFIMAFVWAKREYCSVFLTQPLLFSLYVHSVMILSVTHNNYYVLFCFQKYTIWSLELKTTIEQWLIILVGPLKAAHMFKYFKENNF